MTTSDRWLRRFHPAPDAAVTLLCLPHAGGSATSFLGLSRALAPSVQVLAVQYPGRQDRGREPLIGSVAELADLLLDVVVERDPGPTALLGHSMGASVAFELALRMQRSGVPPVALFPSGRRAPSLHADAAPPHPADDDDELLARVTRLGGTAAHLLADDCIRAALLPALRNDFRAAETYRGGTAVLDCPIVAMTGRSDPEVMPHEVGSWAQHSRDVVDSRVFDGGHFFIVDSMPAVAAYVGGFLDSLAMSP